jgi:Putative methyltransferase
MDWQAWHLQYEEPGSDLAERLRLVQRHVGAALDSGDGPMRVLSLCAGRGDDIIGVLEQRHDAGRFRVVLVEMDPDIAAVAGARAARAGLAGVTVRCADAGDAATYAEVEPADLLLVCGVFGNIDDNDVRRTVEALPGLCAPAATLIWTRHRRPPDLTPAIQDWLRGAGFVERAFHAPPQSMFSVGVNQLAVAPPASPPVGTLFTFVRI